MGVGEALIATALIGGGLYGGYEATKQDRGKGQDELLKEADERAERKRLERARAMERNKTVYTSQQGLAGMKTKIGQ